MRLENAFIRRDASLALLLFIALAVPPPVAAQTLRRDDVMAEAARYAEHAWEMRAANQKGTCQGEYRSDHPVGKQVGVPYAWGGSMDLAEFDRRIAAGAGAGSHSKDGILTCVAGVDCSGFVSQVWRLKQRQSTSTLNTITRPIALDELRPGDALNKAGKHVVLYAGSTSDGKPVIYEASGSASRVRMATPGWSYLNGYQPIRYPSIEDPPAVASTSTPNTPAPAPATAKPASAANAQAATVPATASPASSASAAVVPASAPASSASAAVVPATASPASSAAAAAVPATASPASNAPAATAPAAASPAFNAAASTVPVASPAAPSASAPAVVRRSLLYGADVGFQPASEDAHALGPDHLIAGPKGVAALHDPVRGQVLVITRDGVSKAFNAGRVDGLSFTPQGDIVVIDSSQRQLRVYRQSGELQRTFDIPRQGPLGALSLEDGVLYATSPDGQRRAIAEFSGGRLRLPQRSVELSKEQLLLLKERVPGGQLMHVGGEPVVVPEKVRISARRIGSWIELVIAATDANGRVRVERSLRRPGQVVALPDGARGAYAPVGDLAVSNDGSVVYLEPGEKEVALAWIEPK